MSIQISTSEQRLERRIVLKGLANAETADREAELVDVAIVIDDAAGDRTFLRVKDLDGTDIERFPLDEGFVDILQQDIGDGRFYMSLFSRQIVSLDLEEVLGFIREERPEFFPTLRAA